MVELLEDPERLLAERGGPLIASRPPGEPDEHRPRSGFARVAATALRARHERLARVP
jgi:hypothetical protein